MVSTHFVIAHVLYILIMLIGCFTIFFLSRNPSGVDRIDYLIAAIVPLWSGLAYLSILLGQGLIENSGTLIYMGRYIDWIITTPLLLLSLCFVAMHETKKNVPLIIGLITLDIIMIVCGILADWASGISTYIWFGIGVCAFIFIFYLIWVPIRRIAKNNFGTIASLYNNLSIYVTILWIGYPSSWILGENGLNIFNPTVELYAFIVLPILSKVGFSLLLLIGLRRLTPNHSPAHA